MFLFTYKEEGSKIHDFDKFDNRNIGQRCKRGKFKIGHKSGYSSRPEIRILGKINLLADNISARAREFSIQVIHASSSGRIFPSTSDCTDHNSA